MGGLISWVVWGLFVGAFARLLVPGRQPIGCVWTILLGVAGSIVGGIIATKVFKIGSVGSFGFGSFAFAVIVSAIALAIAERVSAYQAKRRPPDPLDPYGRGRR